MANWEGKSENCDRFHFLGLQITADGDCSHKFKRHLFHERRAMTNLDSIFRSRDITLPTKVCIVKSYGFFSNHVWMRELAIKKAEHWRTDAFQLWCYRILLRILWTARRSNQLVLKEINPDDSLEALMLKLQYFGHLMHSSDSLENILMLGKIEVRRRRGWQRMS